MLKNLFSPDSGLMIVLNQITDCIFLSLFWLLGCFPVVTIGASFAALYDATWRSLRKGERHSWMRFVSVFRNNWKSALLPTLVFLVLAALLGAWMIRLWNAVVWGQLSWLGFAALGLVAVFLLGILSILFPLLSRFENSFGRLLKNTLLLGLANAPRTLALGILNAAGVVLCLRFVFPVFFLPSLAALLGSWFLEPMFRPFLPPEDASSE